MNKVIALSIMSFAMLISSSSFAMSKAEASKILLSVAVEGNAEGVYQMISQGANIDIKDNTGRTPLLNAIVAGQIEIVSILLAKGANVNHEDNKGSTALILACENNYPVITEMVSKYGADFQHKNNEGFSALMISSLHGRDDIVAQLVSAGATKGFAKDSDGNSLDIKKNKQRPVVPSTRQFYAGL